MRYGSICSGISADHLAFDWMDCQWFSEIEKFPCAVLQHHYPDIPNHGDMTGAIEKYTAVDVVVGGTPCQGFSVAGQRKGLDDDRSGLALRFLEIITHTRPRWVVWENVPGVFSTGGGRDFGAFIGELGQRGYGWAYRTFDAQYFGVPQRRRRVFVVGHLGDWRPAAAVLFERHSLQGHPAPSQETGESSATEPGEGTEGASNDWISGPLASRDYKDCGTDGMNKGSAKLALQMYENHPNDSRVKAVDACPTLDKRIGTGGGNLPLVQSTDGALQERDRKGIGTTVDDKVVLGFHARQTPISGSVSLPLEAKGGQAVCYDTIQITSPLNYSNPQHGSGVSEDQAYTLNTVDRDVMAQVELSNQGVNSGNRGWAPKENPSYTLDASGMPSTGIATSSRVRRLTPRECERLMGFPDDFTQIPYRGKPAEQCPDGPRYAALGNSIAVPVLKWIGDRIRMV